MLLGGPEPFDRHDWVIDRCGQEVRYVIDFYYYDDKAGTPEVATTAVYMLFACMYLSLQAHTGITAGI
jgi:hypothetical protein